jgi:cysteine desulfurase/selenocysteine lyase
VTAVLAGTQAPAFDVERVRRDFPILASVVNGKPLVYLDNASTSQKPVAVIEAISRYYQEENSNIHRGVHRLSELATAAYEAARVTLQDFLGAAHPEEIVFTRGTTEGINLVAQSYGRPRLIPGDEIVVSGMEHHSNIVPWQLLAEQTGAVLRVVPVDEAGNLDLTAFQALLGSRSRIVALTQLSNVTGTINPIRQMADLAHAAGAVVVVDGAQSAPHMGVNVQELGCDFFACSGHKMLGPTGIGVLFGRMDLFEAMPPYQGGGGMIGSVSFEGTTYATLPGRFEAGTPHIAGAIGLAAAVRYLEGVGLPAAQKHESELLSRAVAGLREIPGLRLIGAGPGPRASVVSFVLDGIHPHDAGTILDQEGVAVRGGHHCAQPLMRRFGISGTIRASFSLYNTRAEVDALLHGLVRVREVFA